ncbi:cytochrome c [Thalassovita sp.]|uniref:c-type cytochrome n=1 Tax=Thalassovita sp. TaxID=1979401 RepID=UPI0029DE5B6B|nr:cytochrome c [Thalassovita sp.]
MKTYILSAAAVAVLGLGAYAWLQPGDTAQASTPPDGAALVEIALPSSLSAQAEMGQRAFNAICADCHGDNATGRMNMGPPLVHKIYEPSHHGDMSFLMAVERGVNAHHWPFGNMPPQPGLTRADVGAIVAYVRELQRANGIN